MNKDEEIKKLKREKEIVSALCRELKGYLEDDAKRRKKDKKRIRKLERHKAAWDAVRKYAFRK